MLRRRLTLYAIGIALVLGLALAGIATSRESFTVSIAIGTFVVALLLLLELWMVGRALQPLKVLTQAAQTIASGEWRDIPEVRRKDEVGLLAQAFTQMTGRLKESLDGLRRSEARLEEAQRVAHVGYWERDLVEDRVTWSDETYRIFGLTPGKDVMTVDTANERIFSEDRAVWNETLARTHRDRSPFDLELRVVRPTGEVRFVHCHRDVILDSTGQARSLFGTVQDITDRKRAEEALRASEEKWRAVFQHNPTMYFMIDAAGTVLSVNTFGAEQLGYRVEELTGASVLNVFHDADRADAQRYAARCLEHFGTTMSWELRKVRKDGSMLWVRETAKAVLVDERPVVLIVCEDITDRKNAEQELRTSEARFRTFVDHATDAFVLAGEDGTILDVNRQASESLGYSRAELIGMRAADIDPDANSIIAEAISRRIELGEIVTFEATARRKDGTVFPVEVRVREFIQGGRRLSIALMRDITDRKRADEAMRDMRAELVRANRIATMGQLTGSIAHEVNQPLTAMVSNANATMRFLNRREPELEEARQAINCIVKDGHRAGDVLRGIRALVKKAKPQTEQLDINVLTREVIELTRSEAIRNGVLVRADLTDGLPLVEGDRVQLQQVLLNLIINGFEAMSASDSTRELSISSLKTEDDQVLVAVRDSGPGLAPDTLERLFESFYTTKPDGMGMGLAICRSIVEGHGGQLWAANGPRGAVFQFTLPVKSDPNVEVADAQQEQAS
jgi:PAS domain S-box-containing protein